MRLGLRPTVFEPGTETWSKSRKLYGNSPKIWERHRHRYEVNPEYVEKLNSSGLLFVGKDEKGERMQFLELRGSFTFTEQSSTCSLIVCNGRPSFLRWLTGPPGILHAATEPISALPWVCGCIVWGNGFG